MLSSFLYFVLSFASVFLHEEPGERAYDPGAASRLLFRLGEDAVDELQMAAHHPFRGALHVLSAEELERGSDGDHHSAAEMRLQAVHEDLLLRGPEGDPDYVGSVGIHHPGYRGIVEAVDVAERELVEEHAADGRVETGEVVPQAAEGLLGSAEEGHAVFPGGDYVAEDLAAAVLVITSSVDPSYVQGHKTAVAKGKHASVHDRAVFRVAVYAVEDDAVGHAYVAGSAGGGALADTPVDAFGIEFVVNVEVRCHTSV